MLATALLAVAFFAAPATALDFPGPSPGTATARLDAGKLILENDLIRGTWNCSGEQLGLVQVVDRFERQDVRL